jgi:hypothetical protein
VVSFTCGCIKILTKCHKSNAGGETLATNRDSKNDYVIRCLISNRHRYPSSNQNYFRTYWPRLGLEEDSPWYFRVRLSCWSCHVSVSLSSILKMKVIIGCEYLMSAWKTTNYSAIEPNINVFIYLFWEPRKCSLRIFKLCTADGHTHYCGPVRGPHVEKWD